MNAAREATRTVAVCVRHDEAPERFQEKHPGSLRAGADRHGSSLRPLRLCGEQFQFGLGQTLAGVAMRED